MPDLQSVPEWFGTAAIGAVIAALGYLAKTVIRIVTTAQRAQRERRAALVRLGALLRASHVAFIIQNELAQRLLRSLETKYTGMDTEGGYERAFSRAYDRLSDEDRELHAVIRGYTTSALRPTNEKLLEWLRADTDFKVRMGKGGIEEKLAQELAQLEAHLLLWLAKYDAWIPNQPQHALVYLADEERHGLGFPSSIDQTVKRVLARRPGVSTAGQSEPEAQGR
jgi:ribosomal protein L17